MSTRYNVGEEVLFINIKYKPAELRFSSLYLPWCDTLEEIKIKKLVCKEHHRVPGDWDDVIQYDGFIFSEQQDGKEKIYNNQYPRASYGQLDDSCNWRVNDFTDDDMIIYTDASKFLNTILRGIKELKDKPDFQQALQKHFDEVVSIIETMGYKVEVAPWVVEKTDGTSFVMEDILHSKLIKV